MNTTIAIPEKPHADRYSMPIHGLESHSSPSMLPSDPGHQIEQRQKKRSRVESNSQPCPRVPKRLNSSLSRLDMLAGLAKAEAKISPDEPSHHGIDPSSDESTTYTPSPASQPAQVSQHSDSSATTAGVPKDGQRVPEPRSRQSARFVSQLERFNRLQTSRQPVGPTTTARALNAENAGAASQEKVNPGLEKSPTNLSKLPLTSLPIRSTIPQLLARSAFSCPASVYSNLSRSRVPTADVRCTAGHNGPCLYARDQAGMREASAAIATAAARVVNDRDAQTLPGFPAGSTPDGAPETATLLATASLMSALAKATIASANIVRNGGSKRPSGPIGGSAVSQPASNTSQALASTTGSLRLPALAGLLSTSSNSTTPNLRLGALVDGSPGASLNPSFANFSPASTVGARSPFPTISPFPLLSPLLSFQGNSPLGLAGVGSQDQSYPFFSQPSSAPAATATAPAPSAGTSSSSLTLHQLQCLQQLHCLQQLQQQQPAVVSGTRADQDQHRAQQRLVQQRQSTQPAPRLPPPPGQGQQRAAASAGEATPQSHVSQLLTKDALMRALQHQKQQNRQSSQGRL